MASGRHRQRPPPTPAVPPKVPIDEDDATRQAVMAVVQVWLDRLQLISVITTFFSSTDGLLLSFTTNLAHIGSSDVSSWSNSTMLMNASVGGALIFHVCAAITSFIGSFVLIRYKLLNAKRNEHCVEVESASQFPPVGDTYTSFPTEKTTRTRHASISNSAPAAAHMSRSRSSSTGGKDNHNTFATITGLSDLNFNLPNIFADIFSNSQGRVSIHRVHPFAFLSPSRRGDAEEGGASKGTELDPPVRLLARCHTISVIMAVCGFILAIMGIIVFAWTALPRAVSIFITVCLAACFGTTFIAFTLT